MSEHGLTEAARGYLRDRGHNVDDLGVCAQCWREAASLYAGGQGAYESHTEAYHAVLEQTQRSALEGTEGIQEGEG